MTEVSLATPQEQAAAIAAAVAKETAKVTLEMGIALVGKDIGYIRNDITDIKLGIKELSGQFVTRAEFGPVKNIVFGMVSIMGIATIAAVLRLVLQQ